MLHQVLQAIESAPGAVNLNELSQKLNIERSALDGMIQFWVRKGRLKDDSQPAQSSCCSTTSSCGHSCSGAQECPFVMKLPRTYSITLSVPD